MKVGYASVGTAIGAAKRMREWGVWAGGQQCKVVKLKDGSWAVWTAHNIFNLKEFPGKILLPRGKEISPSSKEAEDLLGEEFYEIAWQLRNRQRGES